ncbi:MAG: peptidylprolyl isomerase [Gammaproteobacteria bacterium]|nr:peptidylprolyl isomerase [Gammaproteobacteria bacterium]
MQITHNTVVAIHYVLKDTAGEIIDRSEPGDAMHYLHGAGNIISGLEKALEGRRQGDSIDVHIAAEDAYGPSLPFLIQEVPLEAFAGVGDIQPGMRFQADTEQGPVPVVVTHVSDSIVTVDGNHPLAGQALHFAVEIETVRAASDEELSHGHVHGAGGHHHDH